MYSATFARHNRPLIFVVDDHDDTREMMRQYFELNGFEVAACADGWQAVPEAVRLQPDVIVLDGRLPGQDGCAITRQLRSAAGAVAKTPIVFVSALADAESKAAASHSGCSCFLAKPVDLERLIETVNKLVSPVFDTDCKPTS